MKFSSAEPGSITGSYHKLELTRRNLETLLAKLDDPLSEKTIIDPHWQIVVKAVENDEHYADRPPGQVYMPSLEKYL